MIHTLLSKVRPAQTSDRKCNAKSHLINHDLYSNSCNCSSAVTLPGAFILRTSENACVAPWYIHLVKPFAVSFSSESEEKSISNAVLMMSR
jgi:hypothetical protein